MHCLLRSAWGCLAAISILQYAAPAADAYASIGQKIWRNECAGSVSGLVSWNAGEGFLSLGIGHFIWYPVGHRERFTESLPQLMAFAAAHGVQVPYFFRGAAPWPNRAAFLSDHSGLAERMRRWLVGHVHVQAQFMAARSLAALPTLLRSARDAEAVRARYNALAATEQGLYCIIDYVNFKGEGTAAEERYRGEGWGLLQVLEQMRGRPTPTSAPAEFARAAQAVLRRRVRNAPPVRGEQRWLQGWLNRCRTYAL